MMKRHLNRILILLFAFHIGVGTAMAQAEISSQDSSIELKDIAVDGMDSAVAVDTFRMVIHDTVYVEQVDTSTVAQTFGDDANKGLKKIQSIFSIGKIFWSIIFLIFSYFLIRISVYIVDGFAERSTRYRFVLKSISPFIKILGWFIAIFIVIQVIFHPPKETLLAFGASFGIAIGFAAHFEEYIRRDHDLVRPSLPSWG